MGYYEKRMIKILSVVLVIICIFSFSACSKTSREIKKESAYSGEVQDMGIFDNTAGEALPQTIIYKLITDHFDSPLPNGKTVKKAIFFGI
ncbi:MAG: hypothetical protein LIO43_01880 [Clostridiales bacterium]|nr:hypothetical protein [Clostridiales bacterium]